MNLKRYVLPLLVLINLALAGVLAWLWFTPEGELKNTHWDRPSAQKSDFASMMPPLPVIAPADTGQFMALLDRPLFSLTRRPPPPPPPPAPPPPVDHLSTAKLMGIVDGGTTGGIIINIAGANRRVRLNEQVDGWVVKSVQGRQVTFNRGGETRTLQLQRSKVSTYTGAAMPAPAQPTAAQPGQPIEAAPNSAPSSAPNPAPAPAAPATPLRPTFGATRR